MDRRTALKLGALAAISPALASLVACAVPSGEGSGDGTPSGGGSSPNKPDKYTIDNIRDWIVGIDEPVQLEDETTRAAINFDNAATTPAIQEVLDSVVDALPMYGSIGRGFSQKSNLSTDTFTDIRDKVLGFLNADWQDYTCFFVTNTTEGLNKLATALTTKDSVVLATRAEHHANDLPWRNRCKMLYAEVDEDGRVIYDDIERLLSENKVDYVTVTAASNVTGYVTDVHRIAKMAHAHGARIVVDGAQIVAHRRFSMKGDTPEENIDFFAFSAHKMYAPFGGGAVVGLTEVLNEHQPEFYGGGTVRVVADDWAVYKDAPELYEAGSPNYLGAVAMAKAIDILTEIGFDAIEEHEQKLLHRMMDGLKKIDKLIIYGDSENFDDRVGVISINHPEVNTFVLAQRMKKSWAVASRRGAFCAHPYVWRLMGISDDTLHGFAECTDVNTAGMMRMSFGIYNTEAEVDEFLAALPEGLEMAKEDMNHFSRAVPEY
ncbi:MAG: aminotransferase class V-fold PLP-dependent enzyme [Atopobiaceae bacterium]|nr:aminotransferase class V-fold PLP-dependent enzyme [Atopobiaceae bacterium]